MATGKISNLPAGIREQLNQRLDDGEPGNQLVNWLNSQPEVAAVLKERFGASPISEQNLSEWRKRGYQEWLVLRTFLDETHVLSENAGQIADTGVTSEHLHLVLIAHYAQLLRSRETMPEIAFNQKSAALRKLTSSIMTMRRSELQKERLQIQRERLELQREKQSAKSASSSSSRHLAGKSASAPGTPGECQSGSESRHSPPPSARSTPELKPAPNTPVLAAPYPHDSGKPYPPPPVSDVSFDPKDRPAEESPETPANYLDPLGFTWSPSSKIAA